jgi:hypothetical protein
MGTATPPSATTVRSLSGATCKRQFGNPGAVALNVASTSVMDVPSQNLRGSTWTRTVGAERAHSTNI